MNKVLEKNIKPAGACDDGSVNAALRIAENAIHRINERINVKTQRCVRLR